MHYLNIEKIIKTETTMKMIVSVNYNNTIRLFSSPSEKDSFAVFTFAAMLINAEKGNISSVFEKIR